MAEILVARITVRLAWQLFAPKTALALKDGDLAEERLRQLLLNEFQKIHEHLNALRRKELVSAVAFLETGFGVLGKDDSTAKEEFTKARNAAQMALGVVADYKDKLLAAKILVTATFQEFDSNLVTAEALCNKYMERLNSLPEVIKAAELTFSPEQKLTSKMFSLSGKDKREDLLMGVAEINKCVHDFFIVRLLNESEFIPVIRFGKYHINPVSDMVLYRNPQMICEIEKSEASFIAATISEPYLFAALGQSPGSAALTGMTNNIMAVNLESGKKFHLLGHKAVVLELCSNDEFLFSGSYDKDVIVWDLKNLQPLKILSGHEGSIRSLCVSSHYLFTASADNSIRVWDIETFSLKQTITVGLPVTKVTCSRRKFLFVASGANRIEIWDSNTFQNLHTFQVEHQITNVIANDSSMYIPAKNASEQMILVYNLGSLTLSATLKESGKFAVKFYNSPYLFTGTDKVRMISTTSERLICEKVVNVYNQIDCDEIKYMTAHKQQLYILCQHKQTSRNFLVKL